MELKEGMSAPEFSLPDSEGNKVALSDYRGKNVILYFYPKDNTKGCTLEAISFRDNYEEIMTINTVVLGISKDSLKSHIGFISKYHLPFILLSDEEGKVCELFDVWKKKKMYGREYMGIERTTFLIDQKGEILRIFKKVKVEGHVEELLQEIKNKK